MNIIYHHTQLNTTCTPCLRSQRTSIDAF